MPEPHRRFDGADLWGRLSAEHQAVIGAIVLELGVCMALIDRVDRDSVSPEGVDPLIERPADAAMGALTAGLREAVTAVVPPEVLDAQDGPRPYFPSLLGGICRTCGCTQNDACVPRCSWAAEDLCSACGTGR